MRRFLLLLLVTVVFAVAPRPASADGRGAFVFTLGNDTTSVERYTRTREGLEVDQLGRSPRVLRRSLRYTYANGAVQKFSLIVTPPGANAPTQMVEATRDGDSLRISTKTGGTAPVASAIALPGTTLLVAASSPWAVFEGEIQRLVKSRADTLGGLVHYLGASSPDRYRVEKLGRDSVSLWIYPRGDRFHARVDKNGLIQGTRPIAGTFQIALSRPATLDLEALTSSYRTREQAGNVLGVLSPRDTVRATAAGATLVIDYSRPAKRGRDVFGALVPYGQVWRTGANAATQLRVDRALDIGGNAVPAGAYSVWTIPGASGWKLVLNSETGQPGTAHKAELDMFTTDMNVSALPQVVERFTISVEPTATGGVLHLDWDTTRASIAFTVKQE